MKKSKGIFGKIFNRKAKGDESSRPNSNDLEQSINVRDITDSTILQVFNQNSLTSMSLTDLENKIKEANSFYSKGFLEDSIRLYEDILKDISKNEYPSHYGYICGQLGQVYTLYSRETEREKNLLKSINAYEKAIVVFKEIDDKIQLSNNYSNLGIVYCRMAEIRNSKENYLQALSLYEKSNLTIGKEEDLQGYLQTLSSMGNTYISLSNFSDKLSNLEKALELYNEILENVDESSTLYVNTMVNLAIVSRKKYELTLDVMNLKESIELFEKALHIYKVENYSNEYSLINHNLSNDYRELSYKEDPETNITLAIKFSSKALQIRTRDKWSVDYAYSSKISGINYLRKTEISNNESDLKRAIEAFNEALSIFTIADNPIENAQVNFQLGNAYHLMANFRDKQENINNAITHIEFAEEVYNSKHNTIDLAKINLKLGQLYSELFYLNNDAFMKNKSLYYLKEALPIFTKETLTDLVEVTNKAIFNISNQD